MLAIALFLGYAATRGARLPRGQYRCYRKHRTYSTRFPSAENPVSEGSNWINGETAGMDWANVRTTLAPSGLVLRRLREAPVESSYFTLPDSVPKGEALGSVTRKKEFYEEVELRLRSSLLAHRRPDMKLLSMFQKREKA